MGRDRGVRQGLRLSLEKTHKHIVRVRELLGHCVKQLIHRALHHDASKLEPVEAQPLALLEAMNMKFGQAKFGTPEYEERKKVLAPMLEHHYAQNSHHPEHRPEGVDGMDLFDVVEMFVYWKAASEREDSSSMNLEIACDKYAVSDQLRSIFRNTADRMGWPRS